MKRAALRLRKSLEVVVIALCGFAVLQCGKACLTDSAARGSRLRRLIMWRLSSRVSRQARRSRSNILGGTVRQALPHWRAAKPLVLR
jgi:hypothetical protein